MIIRGQQRPPRASHPGRLPPSPEQKPSRPVVAAVAARKAAVEKSLARYFELTCGHYGTRELDELMRDWRTKRLQHYCETCNNWRLSKQNYTRGSEIPMEPMF